MEELFGNVTGRHTESPLFSHSSSLACRHHQPLDGERWVDVLTGACVGAIIKRMIQWNAITMSGEAATSSSYGGWLHSSGISGQSLRQWSTHIKLINCFIVSQPRFGQGLRGHLWHNISLWKGQEEEGFSFSFSKVSLRVLFIRWAKLSNKTTPRQSFNFRISLLNIFIAEGDTYTSRCWKKIIKSLSSLFERSTSTNTKAIYICSPTHGQTRVASPACASSTQQRLCKECGLRQQKTKKQDFWENPHEKIFSSIILNKIKYPEQ